MDRRRGWEPLSLKGVVDERSSRRAAFGRVEVAQMRKCRIGRVADSWSLSPTEEAYKTFVSSADAAVLHISPLSAPS